MLLELFAHADSVIGYHKRIEYLVADPCLFLTFKNNVAAFIGVLNGIA